MTCDIKKKGPAKSLLVLVQWEKFEKCSGFKTRQIKKKKHKSFFSFSTRTVSLLFWINNLIFRNRFINWLYLHNKKKVLLCNENMKFSNKEKNWKRQIKQRSLRLQSNNCYEKSIFTWLFVDFFFFFFENVFFDCVIWVNFSHIHSCNNLLITVMDFVLFKIELIKIMLIFG